LTWAVEDLRGPAAWLHTLGPGSGRRLLRWCEATGPAVVIGSAQPWTDVVDGVVPVVRRVSGGSAVLVGPGEVAWLDVVVPRGDALWSDDVGVAPVWLGRVWAGALASLGVAGPTVHEGPMVRTPWSAVVCFAGIGAGEVLAAGRKVVGISQRRTREVALFQTAALLRWDPAAYEAVVTRSGAVEAAAVGLDELLGRAVAVTEVREAVLAALAALEGPASPASLSAPAGPAPITAPVAPGSLAAPAGAAPADGGGASRAS
jgi:lipoate-protein ligase A